MMTVTPEAIAQILAVGGGATEIQPEFWVDRDNRWALDLMGLTVAERPGVDGGEPHRILVPVDMPGDDIDRVVERSRAAIMVVRDRGSGSGGR